LVRKGRLDEIFFVDLPEAAVREHIFAIHLRQRDLPDAEYDLAALAEASAGFSGAEIEQAVVSALYQRQSRDTPPGTEDILLELERTRPLSVVMADQIAALRQWAEGRTVAAGENHID
jgi:SpoVK/Ycf46/Vps4 family AAA+-type ATPase